MEVQILFRGLRATSPSLGTGTLFLVLPRGGLPLKSHLICVKPSILRLDPRLSQFRKIRFNTALRISLTLLLQCVDITFAEQKDVADVNETNCFNSTDLSFNNVYSIPIAGSKSSALRTIASVPGVTWTIVGLLGLWALV